MPKIVISYRRSDSDAIAGRIRDRLANQYGEGAIFMDIDSIPLGIDFRQHVQGALSQSDLVIAVVGPKWLGARHRARARIMEDNDPVRIEIETALQSGVRLIPVLVNHATMPKPSDLPKSLEQFAYHNAAEVDAGRDFHQHMERLIRSTDEILGLASRSPIAPARLSRKWLMTAASVAACALLGGAIWLFRNEIGPITQAPPQPAPPQPNPPAPATAASTLSVLSAIYGDNCPFNPDDKGQVDVTSLIAQFCKKEPTGLCRYPIQNRVLGDPSKGCAKSLRVRYGCGGEKDAVIKEAFVPPEAAGNYALLTCSGTTGAIRSTLEDGVDRAGYDYRNFMLPNPETKPCQDACLGDARCRAWTFVRAGLQGPSSACWLKSDVPAPANRACCVSGIIR
jgi:hypothetical protein